MAAYGQLLVQSFAEKCDQPLFVFFRQGKFCQNMTDTLGYPYCDIGIGLRCQFGKLLRVMDIDALVSRSMDDKDRSARVIVDRIFRAEGNEIIAGDQPGRENGSGREQGGIVVARQFLVNDLR